MQTMQQWNGRRRGAAMVEFLVLLLPLMLVVFGMAYIGQLGILRGRENFAGQLAMDTPGDQSERPGGNGTVRTTLYPETDGDLTVVEGAPSPSIIPGNNEIREMFDEMTEPVYSTYATGSYQLVGDHIEFVVQTHQSSRLSRDGHYVQSYRLQDNFIPEMASDLSVGWVRRNRVETTYQYHPAYLSMKELEFQTVDMKTVYQSTVRDERQRSVTNVGAGLHHPIEEVTGGRYMPNPGVLPHYPDFSGDQDFWESN